MVDQKNTMGFNENMESKPSRDGDGNDVEESCAKCLVQVLHLVGSWIAQKACIIYIYIHSLSLVYNLQKDKYFFLSHQNLGIAILKWTINGI